MIDWTRPISEREFLKGELADEIKQPILGFWKWAFSDLRQSIIRSAFAEWLVAQILDLPSRGLRDTWGVWDLVTGSHIKIEVKSASKLQYWTWKKGKPSVIQFQGLKSRLYDEENKVFHKEKTYNSDLYIFCVQIEENYDNWNALNLDQWRFSVLIQRQLVAWNGAVLRDKKLGELASIHDAYNMSAPKFRDRTRELIREMERVQKQ